MVEELLNTAQGYLDEVRALDEGTSGFLRKGRGAEAKGKGEEEKMEEGCSSGCSFDTIGPLPPYLTLPPGWIEKETTDDVKMWEATVSRRRIP